MSESSTERARVPTYVPASQKESWAEDADSMDMSLSEFVRTMVQAGRRGFPDRLDVEQSDATEPHDGDGGDDSTREEPASPPVNPRGRDLETVLLDELHEAPREFEALVEACLADVRETVTDDVGDALQALQSENVVTHDPRAGGYTLVDDE